MGIVNEKRESFDLSRFSSDLAFLGRKSLKAWISAIFNCLHLAASFIDC